MNRLKDVSVAIPKRQLTVFTGVSGNLPSVRGTGAITVARGEGKGETIKKTYIVLGGMCPRCEETRRRGVHPRRRGANHPPAARVIDSASPRVRGSLPRRRRNLRMVSGRVRLFDGAQRRCSRSAQERQ